LAEYSREQLPFPWARIQGGLGEALLELGEKETSRVQYFHALDAVSAFESALSVVSDIKDGKITRNLDLDVLRRYAGLINRWQDKRKRAAKLLEAQ